MDDPAFYYLSHVHFDELDALGVLHHTRYLIHLERAQQAFFQDLLGVDDFGADRDEDIYVVVRGLTSRFREPVRNPGEILVKYEISKVRAAGVSMDFSITDPEGKALYCTGERIVCKLSGVTHQPTPWTEPFEAAMKNRLVKD